MFHTIITIDIATIGPFLPEHVIELLEEFDQTMAYWPVEFEDWKVRVHQEHNGVITAVPGYTTPEGIRE